MQVYEKVKIRDSSHRVRDEKNGFLKVYGNPVAVAGVYPYRRSQVDTNASTDDVVNVYRPVENLVNKKAEFAHKPIVKGHEDVGAQGTRYFADGAIGSEVWVNDNTLYSDLIIYNPELIHDIESGACTELSPGYHANIVPQRGVYEGVNYEYVMNITNVNHLAVVPNGRAGRDLRILDKGNGMSDNIDTKAQNEPVTKSNSDTILHNTVSSKAVQSDEGGHEKHEAVDKKTSTKAQNEASEAEENEEQGLVGQTLGDLDRIVDRLVSQAINKKTKALEAQFESYYKSQFEQEMGRRRRINDAANEVSKYVGYVDSNLFQNETDVYSYAYEALRGVKLSDGMDPRTAFLLSVNNEKLHKVEMSISDAAQSKYSSIFDKVDNLFKKAE